MKKFFNTPHLFFLPERILFSLFLLCIFFAACQQTYTPKPRGYFKIIFPEHQYHEYNPENCPFTFEYPVYSKVVKDTVFFDTIPENPCWMNITFPEFNGIVFLSYKDINAKNNLSKLIEDTHVLTYKHTVKADYIDEGKISTPNRVYGLYYSVGGNAASNVQFFVTDSAKHFIRGSLYFNNTPNVDSIAPVLGFVKQDINHIISSIKWKE